MPVRRLDVTRRQILHFRRRVNGLDQRQKWSRRSVRLAAWAGLQDSMPRAALLSLHARLSGVSPSAWEDPSLVQVWGPRFSAYVVAAPDRALFTVARSSEDPVRRQESEDLADRLEAVLDGDRMTYAQAGRLLGVSPNSLRYAAPTGRFLIRWEGARQPTIWAVPAPEVDRVAALLELVRRYLHIFGPATPTAFAQWAGIKPHRGNDAFGRLTPELTPVKTPIGDAWTLTEDEETLRSPPEAVDTVRLIPSGDAFFLLQGRDRELLVAESDLRRRLWTPRVWPGALIVDGEIMGTWRRSQATVTIEPWRRISRAQTQAVESEARTLPLPGIGGGVKVRWGE